jgi:hypothetical protein
MARRRRTVDAAASLTPLSNPAVVGTNRRARVRTEIAINLPHPHDHDVTRSPGSAAPEQQALGRIRSETLQAGHRAS